MSKIRVDELINQSNSGPTLAVEGLRVPSTKSLVVEGIISLNGDTGLTGQVLSRTTTGVGWSNVPLTDNNTTYTLSTDDGANPATDKVIRLTAGGSGSGSTDVVLVAGNNVSLTRSGGRITIDSSFTDTNTVTRLGVNGQNYTDGDLNLIGTGAATITQSGRTFTINVNDDNTTYTGESGVTITGDNKIKIGQPVGPNDPVTFQQVTVSGNLIVQGTTTTSNTVTISTQDKFINLNDVLIPTDAVADGGGIKLKGDSPHTILWSNTNDSWTSSEHFNLASGRTYKIDGDEVITSTGLGNVIRASSLESVGVLSAGRWEAQTIGIAYGGTGTTNANDALNAFLPSQAANASKYLTTDGQDTSWAAIPPTYNGWSVGDNSVTTSVDSNDIVRFIGTGSALVTLDNVQKRLTINADNTTYNLSVENQQQPNRKSIRLTDNTGNFEEVVLSAGTGVTLTRTGTRLEFSVAQDLSASAIPTFTGVDVTGTVNATTYTGSAAQLSNLTGVPNGVYGSSGVIPVISVDPTGRITNISTAPNTGAAGSGGIVAGGSDYSLQYNNNGGLAGSDKIKFEPIQGELTLSGYLVSDNIVSTGATITELQALDYIKFPSKTISERDYLNVLNGSVIYNNVSNRLEMYQDGEWIPIGGITQLGDLLDVQAGHPGDGQVLSFSSNGNRWVPTTITASGGIQQNSSLVVNNNTIPSGSGSITFNASQNVLTYNPPDISSFISTETDPIFSASPASGITTANISNWNTAYSWGDHSIVGYLQATNTDKANWNTAYSWGDHSSAGYITSEVDTLDSVTGRGNTTINNISVGRLTAGGLLYPNTNGTAGQVLTSDGSGNIVWQNTASGGSNVTAINQLTDVSISSPSSGDVLYFNGANWTNGPQGSGGYGDSDVSLHLNTSSASAGQILSWNGTDFVWVADQTGSSGSSTFVGLTDTPSSMGTAGQFIAVNSGGTALEFVAAPSGGGGANVTISDNPPANPSSGDLWWESDKGRLKILYSTVWVDANPVGGGGGGGSGSYANGDVDSHLNTGNASSNQILSWNGTDYAWIAQPTDTDTTYTAGTGISLAGTQFSLDSTSSPTFAGLSLNGQALPFTDGTFDLGSTTKKWRFVYTDGLVAGGLTYPTSNGNSGQVLTSNGSGGVTWTTVSGGGGSGIALTDLSVTTAAAAASGGLSYNSANGQFQFVPPDLSPYSTFSGNYADLVDKPTLVTTLGALSDVDVTGAANGKILKYNGSSWEMADDLTGSGGGGSGIALTDLSVTTGTPGNSASGLSYNDGTGVFTYTTPTLQQVMTAGNGQGAASTNHRIQVQNSGSFALNLDPSGISTNLGVGIDIGNVGTNSWKAQIDGSSGDISTAGDITATGNLTADKIYYSNVFSQLADLPSASTYHGMFAHVHATGKGYFAHGGAWIPLANESMLGNAGNWDTAYGWGNHASSGYLVATNADKTNWNAAYLWGDHSLAGYSTTSTVINNNAAERVITGSATTGELNASDKLTIASNGIMTLNGQLIVDQVNINGNQIQPNTANTNLKINGNGTGVVEVTGDMSVTGTVDGRDVSADGTKLDGIASGATNTAAPYYTSAIPVADGGLTQNNFTNALLTKLNGIATGATAYTSNQATNTTSAVTFASVYATGNVTAYSDISLKKDVHTIDDALYKVTKLRGVSYVNKVTKRKSIGVIAQEIEEVLPEVVEMTGDANYKSVAYGNIVGVLIEAIKELKTELDDVKKKLNEGNM